jgi:hypothetical protein
MSKFYCETYLKCSSLPVGQVTGGKLTIRGPLIELLWDTDKFLYEKSFSSSSPKDLGPKFGSRLPECCKYVLIGKKNVLSLPTDHEQTRPQSMILQPTDPNTSDLLGAGSIWSSNVDSASMWIWIGPSGWWIGVDLRLI